MKLVHIEASSDRLTWEKRREKLIKKFNYRPREVLELFNGLNLPTTIERQAVFLFKSNTLNEINDVKVIFIDDLLKEIFSNLKDKKITNEIMPETYPILRTMHILFDQRKKIRF